MIYLYFFFFIAHTTLSSSHDTIPPTPPRGLTGHGSSDSSMELMWFPSMDNVGIDHYEIYRGPWPGILVGISTTPYFMDTGLAPDSSYCYRVKAVDPSGNISMESNTRFGYGCGIYTNPVGGNVTMEIVNSPATVSPGDSLRVSWRMGLNPSGSAGHHDAHFNVDLDNFGCGPPNCWYSWITGSSGDTFWTDTQAPNSTGDIWFMPGPHPNNPPLYYNNEHHHFPLQRIVVTYGNPLRITTSSLPDYTPGTPYSSFLSHNNTSEATEPFSLGISEGRLPNDLILDSSTGEISGTPSESGSFVFTVSVKATSENYDFHQFILTEGGMGREEEKSQKRILFFRITPNPFSRISSLHFPHPLSATVSLSLFDLLGKEVKRFHGITAEKIEITGENLASGIYFFQLKEGHELVGVGKVILIK